MLLLRLLTTIALLWVATVPRPASAQSWTRAVRGGDIVYLLDGQASPPSGSLLRYDLAARRWLAAIGLPAPPLALAVDADSLYVGSDTTLSRYPLGGGAPLWSVAVPGAHDVLLDGALVLVSNGLTLRAHDRASGALLVSNRLAARMEGVTALTARRRLYGCDLSRNPTVVRALEYGNGGELVAEQQSPFDPELGGAGCNSRTWIRPSGAVVIDGGGLAFDVESLDFASHLQDSVRDLAFRGDETLALIGSQQIRRLDARFDVLGDVSLASSARALFLEGDSVFAFGEHWSGVETVEEVPLSSFQPPDAGPWTDGPPQAHDVAAGNGVLYLLDGRARSIYRWSLAERRYLEPILLRGSPLSLVHAPELDRLFVDYRSVGSTIQEIDVEAPFAERLFVNVPRRLIEMESAGEHLVVGEYDDEGWTLRSFDAAGGVTDEIRDAAKGWSLAWSGALRRLFFSRRMDSYHAQLASLEIAAGGRFGASLLSVPTTDSLGSVYVSPLADAVIAYPGRVYDAADLAERIPAPALGSVDSAAWADGTLVTLSVVNSVRTRVRSWSAELTPVAEIELDVRALEVLSFGPEIVLPSNGQEGIDLLVLRADDLDRDGVAHDEDAFPSDPGESSDRDGDGVGDNGDRFPDDASEWGDADRDGRGDNTDAFPTDPFEWSDRDGDGVGDNRDPFPDDPTEGSDRDGDGVGDHSDAFPDDPTESVDSDGDGVGNGADPAPFDPEVRLDFDRDGLADHLDPFPVGEPLIGLPGLEGRLRFYFQGLGSLRASMHGSLGLLPDGSFSLCDAGDCVFGSQRLAKPGGRKYLLQPDPAWLAALEEDLEREGSVALGEAFRTPISLQLALDPDRSRFEVKTRGSRGRVQLRAAFEATLLGAPRRFRDLRAVWVWKPRPVRLAAP